MGRLVGIELHNFKSYKGTASIGFGTANFTSIIGPNGSGKSNMMDAISFVLGVRSNHLRSNQLKDLIYRGRIDEDNSQDPDLQVAYVMAIYQKSDGEQLQLKRTISRRGNSEYKVNGATVSAAEYSNLLRKENILIKARNFLVFQGDVEQIASQSPMDLASLIETVSGSSEYKAEYNKVKDEKDRAKELTAAILSKKRTLAGELKQYDEQHKEAELFKSKIQSKNKLIILSTLWRLYHLEQKRQKLSDSISASKSELKRLKAVSVTKEEQFSKIKTKYAKESLQLSASEKNISRKKAELSDKRRELLPITARQEVLQKKIANYSRRLKDLESDIDRQADYVSGVERQIKVVTKAKASAEKEFRSKNKGSQITVEDEQQYEALKEKFMTEGGASEFEKLSLMLIQKSEIEAIITSLKNQKGTSNGRVQELILQTDELQKQLSSVSSELNELNGVFGGKKETVRQLNLANENFLTQEFELKSKLKETLLALDDLSANQRETNRERKLRENVGTLRRLFPGVRGIIHDLCQPKQKKYEIAVSTILGKNFDSVVVENSATAHQCIEYLKEQRSGVISFIPLDSIEANPADSRLRHSDPQARPTIDIIDFDPTLERAMQYVCGNSMVADTLAAAKRLRWDKQINVKVATLEGSLIHKAGLMTGGRTVAQGRSWNKGEVNTLSKLKDDLLYQLDDLQRNRPDPLEAKNLENDLVNIESEISIVRRKRAEIERAILDTDAEMKYYSNSNDVDLKIKQQSDLYNDLEVQISKQEAHIAEMRKDLFSSFCSRLGFKNIKEYESSTGSMIKEQSRELKQYQNQLLKLEQKLEFEKERANETSERIAKIKTEKVKAEELLAELNKSKEEINNETDHLEGELELIITEFKDFEKQLENKLLKSKNAKDELNSSLLSYENEKKHIEILQQDLEEALLERISVLKSCKIENIPIPLLESSLDELPINNNEQVVEAANNIVIDYSKLSGKYKENSSKLIEKEFEDQLAEINKTIESLSPNVKAHERFQEVSTKMKEIEKELLKTRSDEYSTVKRFQEVKGKRYELFINAFNHISNHIDSIYKELTKSNNNALGGGSADLTLEDEDEPYLAGVRYHAMPPMKKFSDMDLLSGGEKTVAALGLLFAIHSFNPSPFFVLDEVDAALDNTNVSRVARYISKHASKEFQFIVISLKNGLFEKSDALVGIYREQRENSSRTLTLDLRNYAEVA